MLHIQQSHLLRVAGVIPLVRLAMIGCLIASGSDAVAQDAAAPCYEVIPPRAKIEPPVPMLVDKCSGRTWLLSRSGRGAYRWAVVDMEHEKPKTTDRPVTDVQPAKREGDPQKCFTFNNRKFCE
jgi:hypothetical protein